ncbi:hypothetical protein [Streptomyces lanatus]|uniref:Uncharacterized protein n=1 Tax=Streptomyces lanatus TaxID=66900 RepID=A0ABV1XUA8_9ACTN|nr:hypothetical protein [Streptomyces lanatus]
MRRVPRRPATATQAREHGISRGAVRTAVVDLMPDDSAADHQATSATAVVTLDTPGKFAEFLRVTELDDAEWATPPPRARPAGSTRWTVAVPVTSARRPGKLAAA